MEPDFKTYPTPAKSGWRWVGRGFGALALSVPLAIGSGLAYVGWKMYRFIQAVEQTANRGEDALNRTGQAAIAKAGAAANSASDAASRVKDDAVKAKDALRAEAARAITAAHQEFDENGGAVGILHEGEAAGQHAAEATEAAAAKARKIFKESGAERKLRDGAAAGAGYASEYYGKASAWLGHSWQPAAPSAPASGPKPDSATPR